MEWSEINIKLNKYWGYTLSEENIKDIEKEITKEKFADSYYWQDRYYHRNKGTKRHLGYAIGKL